MNSQSNDLVFHNWSDCFERREEIGTLHPLSVCIGVVVDAYIVGTVQGIFLKLVEKKVENHWCVSCPVSKSDLRCVWTSQAWFIGCIWSLLNADYTDFSFFHIIPGYFFFSF